MSVPFERTICDCATCRECCHSQPGSLAPGDLERIAKFLHRSMRVTLMKFWASPGALLMNRLTRETYRVGTITPRRAKGKCVFLDDHERCTIHAVAPAGCAFFDTHMNREEGQQRGMWLVTLQQEPEYQSLRRLLPPATSYNPRNA